MAAFPPPACAAPVWAHLWTLLAAGLALRLLGGLSSDWIYREDEVMQYLEPAHRLLFGSGFLTWEQRYGVRNLLTAAPAAGLMALCDAAGRGPDCYVPALAVFNALVSMALPAALYFIARRLYDETAGRVALAVGCFWYTFVAFAPRLMIEQIATISLLSGLALTPPLSRGWALFGRRGEGAETDSAMRPAVWRLWAAGFFIGLAGFIRLQYIPVAAPLGLLILCRLPPRLAPHLVGGAALALLLTGAADWLAWGAFFHSVFAYWEMSQFLGDVFQEERFSHVMRLAICSAGLWPLVFFAAATEWRRHWPALAAVVIVLAVHEFALSQSYSHIFLALPLLALALGGVASRPPNFLRGIFRGNGKHVAAGALALASLAGSFFLFPGQVQAFSHTAPPVPAGESRRLFFQDNPLLTTARFLSRIPPDKMRAALWTGHGPPWTGGYFYFHHHVPYWHAGLESHRPLLRGRDPAEAASHIAAPDPGGARWALNAGFREIASFGGVRVFENPHPEKVQWPEKFPLGFGNNFDAAMDGGMARAGKEVPGQVYLSPPPEPERSEQ